MDDRDDNPIQRLLEGVAERLHKATPGGPGSWDERASYARCAICGQRIKLVPGGYGPVWVHADSGAVVAANPPGYKPDSGTESSQ